MVNLCDQKGREVLMETRMPAKTRDERGWCNISLVNYALGSRRSCTWHQQQQHELVLSVGASWMAIPSAEEAQSQPQCQQRSGPAVSVAGL
jgi:hypothetical protein